MLRFPSRNFQPSIHLSPCVISRSFHVAMDSKTKSQSKKRVGLNSKLNKLRNLTKLDPEFETGCDTLSVKKHEERLENLREIADNLKEDSWKYDNVDKLLGLN